MKTGHSKVSVVLPVFNDRQRLEICLEALEHQTYPKDDYEVVVVDCVATSNQPDTPLFFNYSNTRFSSNSRFFDEAITLGGLQLLRIGYRDPETRKHFLFITKQFKWPAKTIADIYQ